MTQVRLASTTTNNVVTYTVIVSVDNSEGIVKPGMSANVSIIVGEAKDVLCVDNKALKFSPETNTQKFENQGIWLLVNGKPQRFDVKLGLSDDNKTQIISDKIKEGDKVIIASTEAPKKKKMSGGRGGRPF